MGAVLNAANEIAVEAFTAGKIRFGEICGVVELTIAEHRLTTRPTLDDLLGADRWARKPRRKLIAQDFIGREVSPAPITIDRNVRLSWNHS